jgi:hypothetical protein
MIPTAQSAMVEMIIPKKAFLSKLFSSSYPGGMIYYKYIRRIGELQGSTA